MAEQEPTGNEGRSKPTTIDLTKDVEKRDPDNTDAPAVTETRTETFELGEIAAILLMELGAIAGGAPATNGEYDATVWEVLSAAFVDKQEFRRFKRFAMDVDAERGEIMRWIGEMISNIADRPTKGQSDLPPGLPDTNTSSTEPGESEPETQAQPGSAL